MISGSTHKTAQNQGDVDITLLVVEDNDLDAELLSFHLRRINSSVPVARAHHGEEALAILQDAHGGLNSPHRYTVLLDLNMPRMNGFEFLETIQCEPWFKQLDIYILSTSDQPLDRSQAERLGVKDYFVKPVTRDLLNKILDGART